MKRSHKYTSSDKFLKIRYNDEYSYKYMYFLHCKKDLAEKIPKELQQHLETLLSLHEDLFELRASTHYADGFRDGARLMLEIFEE